MEPKPVYQVETPIEQWDVHCPTCGMLVGWYVRVNNQVWLQSGALQLRSLHGICAVCHSEFHYCASEKQLEKLIRKTLQWRTEPVSVEKLSDELWLGVKGQSNRVIADSPRKLFR